MEWVLRAALLALLAFALWRAVRAPLASGRSRAVPADALDAALAESTRDPGIAALAVRLESAPTPEQRDWLAALRRAGVGVEWSGAVPTLVASAEAVREPAGGARVRLAADSGALVMLADSAGVLDSLVVRGGGASLEAETVGPVTVRLRGALAIAPAPRTDPRRAVLVLARAGWESRFVIAALAEAGWTVRARLPVAPGVAVSDAGVLPIDTARYDVVVALDSSAADLAPAVARFVAAGGGLVAAGGATSLGPLRAILPARAGARTPGRILLDGEALSRADLPLRPLDGLRDDAVPLDRERGGLAAAVRRAGLGRAASVGYDDSWRWRMQGGADGPAAHRAWWSRTVGLVAPEHAAVDRMELPAALRGAAAPRAALVDALGPPASGVARLDGTAPRRPPPLVLLAAIAAALLAETASRRFRGAR